MSLSKLRPERWPAMSWIQLKTSGKPVFKTPGRFTLSISSSSNTALIVAGGGDGGGAASGNSHDGDPGQIVEEGSQSGGSNGNGGTIFVYGSTDAFYFEGGVGGGLIGDGESAINAEGGKSFVNGGSLGPVVVVLEGAL